MTTISVPLNWNNYPSVAINCVRIYEDHISYSLNFNGRNFGNLSLSEVQHWITLEATSIKVLGKIGDSVLARYGDKTLLCRIKYIELRKDYLPLYILDTHLRSFATYENRIIPIN